MNILSTQAIPRSKSDSCGDVSPGDTISRVAQRSRTLFESIGTVIWFNLVVVSITPLVSLYGLFTTPWHSRTVLFCVAYYVFNMIGVTAGYHRLWSHRSYKASQSLEYFLAIAGAGAVQGSIKWWARHHRAHHRYTDTDLDPYGAHHGLLWSHIGWMLVKKSQSHGPADISDLKNNTVVAWQHKRFFALAFFFGLFLPSIIPGLFWEDWRGGFYYACFLRLTVVHHCVFSVNSLAHWLGETTFDDKLTPRDHFITAIVTLGEGYHNFHHQFPVDYRNAVKWYQWDPTKWFIAGCKKLGLASHLKTFPEGEVQKSVFTMNIKRLKKEQDSIQWPPSFRDLPVIDWQTYQDQAQHRRLVLISGFIHDLSDFLETHPGGTAILLAYVGKDATAAFFGGIYDHSNAAHNLLATMRVAVLLGGGEHVDARAVPPCLDLRIVPCRALESRL
ncbi:delta 9-fatty acid desaturase protein [Irpex rosettiformis]|uniref:Delta 9-fatty acid desaturase protein n=1 Tax=Irpex rosettiformis TaxID=378272 RepID=A0ACB8UE36_9APHY|nr:delta 9-fatty acid desaturase protein [Irpex rosettiformis]